MEALAENPELVHHIINKTLFLYSVVACFPDKGISIKLHPFRKIVCRIGYFISIRILGIQCYFHLFILTYGNIAKSLKNRGSVSIVNSNIDSFIAAKSFALCMDLAAIKLSMLLLTMLTEPLF